MSRTKVRTAIAACAASLAVALLGFSAAPAQAHVGPISAKLTVKRYRADTYTVSTTGVIPMSQAEAQELISGGHKFVWQLWGDDGVSADPLGGPWGPPYTTSATAQGLAFNLSGRFRSSRLDEDDSRFDDRDELYADVLLLNSRGVTVRPGKSNRVYGRY
jgi:hypothetical protein